MTFKPRPEGSKEAMNLEGEMFLAGVHPICLRNSKKAQVTGTGWAVVGELMDEAEGRQGPCRLYVGHVCRPL